MKINKKKVTNQNLADFYKLNVSTISSWKNSKNTGKKRLYKASKEFYIKNKKD